MSSSSMFCLIPTSIIVHLLINNGGILFCSLGELVEHDKNGLVFSTESELEQQLEVFIRHCIRKTHCMSCNELILCSYL